MRKISCLALLFFFLFLNIRASDVSSPANDRFSLRLFGGGGYYLLDDIKKGLEGWDALWQRKWHNILEGGFLPFHWGICFGTEFEARVKPHFSISIETGFLQARKEGFRKVKYNDGYVDEQYDQTLDIAVKAVPLIISGTFRGLPGKRFSFFGGIGLGLCLGMMDWQFESISPDGWHGRQEWKGWTISPVLQVRTGIELELRKGIFFVLEAVGLLARLQGLKGRLDDNGTVTEDAIFWFNDWGYHDIFFLPKGQVTEGGDIRKGIADLSGCSLRAGIRFLFK